MKIWKASAMFRRTKFLVETIKSSRALLYVYSPLLVAQTVAGIAVPFATGRFIDALVGGSSPLRPFVALAALLLAKAALTPCLQWLVAARARNVELKLQERVMHTVLRYSPSRLSALANGELVAKLTRDAYAVGRFVSGLYPRLVVAVVTMFAAGLALYSRSATLGIAFMAFIPLAIVLFLPFAWKFAKTSHSVRTKSDSSFSTLFDFFHSLPFLRAHNAQWGFVDAPLDALNALKDGNCAMDRLTIVFGSLLGTMLVVGEIAVLGVAGTLAAKGVIPVGDVVTYQLLFLAAMQSIQGIVSLLPETATLREGIDSLDEVLSCPAPLPGCVRTGGINTIEFRNVMFAYPGGSDIPAVSGFSATFRVGRIYALVGANGVGKTTILKLATAAMEPQHGEIQIDGMPLSMFDKDDFRRKIGIVSQNSPVISGTVYDNLTLRNAKFSENDIKSVLRSCGLDEVVKRLPAGLETRIGFRGQSLSGGECQRLAIARSLLRNPSLLVLDEATNHLDSEARESFGKTLRGLAKDRIVLLVSHDEGLVNLCDEKIVCQIPGNPSYLKA